MGQTDAPRIPALEKIQAIAFDVQGTCVDFYQPILRMGEDVNRAKGLDIDWAVLSSEWRDLYRMALDQVITGQRTWLRVDRIYREALDTLLERRDLSRFFDTAERDEMNQIWTRLDPWPDSIEGLARLRRRFVTSTLSNAGMAAVVGVVKHAGLPFDAILTAELAHSYKPSPSVYQLAVARRDPDGGLPQIRPEGRALVRNAHSVCAPPVGVRSERQAGHHTRDLVRSVCRQLCCARASPGCLKIEVANRFGSASAIREPCLRRQAAPGQPTISPDMPQPPQGLLSAPPPFPLT